MNPAFAFHATPGKTALPANVSKGPITAERSEGNASGVPFFVLERQRREAELRYWPPPFASLAAFLAAYSLPGKRYGDWRLSDYVLGHINGLPASRGRMVATNGIMCFIIREDRTLYEGHVQHWVHENNVEDNERSDAPISLRKRSALEALMREL